ncbi:hypothetical protein ACFS5L_21125 [Streptomyces phyllanthi]|uniref:Uncharacterized protein n=1 Tax=Streptomyces phyllanthi TaxID=1803180 RepID=A0A5N8W1C4_9ACTN|nr:hypothetical protein [Streptomyces phyllanthi]MPY41311.1 hypothetical protein [Streptomyces phyllanthi]
MSGSGGSEMPEAGNPAKGFRMPAEGIEDRVRDLGDPAEDVVAADEDIEDPDEDARRARWTAAGAGALLTLAGLGASSLRLTGSAPTLVPAAYAVGAAVCALAAALGIRGRTRRALWLMVVGLMVMALGDQFD